MIDISTISSEPMQNNPLTHLRALIKVLLLVAGTSLCLVLQCAWVLLSGLIPGAHKHQSPFVRAWYSFVLWLTGTKVTVVNRRHLSKRQKLFLSNHISYMDILVLGAYFDCFFVAKMDIAGWPVFGFLAKVGGTVFITRQRQQVKTQLDLLQGHVDAGRSLLIFPEGTTTNGTEIYPFKSSLLNCAFNAQKPPVIQPLSLIYTHKNGQKLQSRDDFDAIAWYGDMTLAPHLWNLFRQKSLTAKVVIHPMMHVSDDITPKKMAEEAHAQVKESFLHFLPAPEETVTEFHTPAESAAIDTPV